MRIALLALLSVALVPLALAAGTWTQASFSQSVIMGVSFSDAKTGFIAGGDNGVGANVLQTTDGGQTFNNVPIHPTMMLLAVASSAADSAVVSGLGLLSGGTQYLENGQFMNSTEPGISMQTTQDAQIVGDGTTGFGVTGQYMFFSSGNATLNGVAFSQDGGASFSFSLVGGDPNVPARYGAFPSSSVGYVTSGTWPSSSKKYGKYLTRNIHMHYEQKTKEAFMHLETEHDNVDEDGWAAAIFVSTDGFETWTQVYSNDTFYFNQISCANEQLCFAAAENDDIGFGFRTTDGGATWEEVLTVPGTSMMAAHVISEDEVYFAGGILSGFAPNGTIFHSTDGGDSFDTTYLPGYYLTGLAFPTSTTGYATAMNTEQQCNVLIYSA